ncbi:hypothetical protein Agub_g15833, partial [Astrephomene gubernaculifera]
TAAAAAAEGSEWVIGVQCYSSLGKEAAGAGAGDAAAATASAGSQVVAVLQWRLLQPAHCCRPGHPQHPHPQQQQHPHPQQQQRPERFRITQEVEVEVGAEEDEVEFGVADQQSPDPLVGFLADGWRTVGNGGGSSSLRGDGRATHGSADADAVATVAAAEVEEEERPMRQKRRAAAAGVRATDGDDGTRARGGRVGKGWWFGPLDNHQSSCSGAHDHAARGGGNVVVTDIASDGVGHVKTAQSACQDSPRRKRAHAASSCSKGDDSDGGHGSSSSGSRSSSDGGDSCGPSDGSTCSSSCSSSSAYRTRILRLGGDGSDGGGSPTPSLQRLCRSDHWRRRRRRRRRMMMLKHGGGTPTFLHDRWDVVRDHQHRVPPHPPPHDCQITRGSEYGSCSDYGGGCRMDGPYGNAAPLPYNEFDRGYCEGGVRSVGSNCFRVRVATVQGTGAARETVVAASMMVCERVDIGSSGSSGSGSGCQEQAVIVHCTADGTLHYCDAAAYAVPPVLWSHGGLHGRGQGKEQRGRRQRPQRRRRPQLHGRCRERGEEDGPRGGQQQQHHSQQRQQLPRLGRVVACLAGRMEGHLGPVTCQMEVTCARPTSHTHTHPPPSTSPPPPSSHGHPFAASSNPAPHSLAPASASSTAAAAASAAATPLASRPSTLASKPPPPHVQAAAPSPTAAFTLRPPGITPANATATTTDTPPAVQRILLTGAADGSLRGWQTTSAVSFGQP